MNKILLTLCLVVSTLGVQAQVANQPEDLRVCDDDNDGLAIFDLTATAVEIFGAQNPVDFTLTYHETEVDAINGTSPIASPEIYINIVNPQAIYARLESIATGLFDTTNFALIVLPLPSPVAPTPLEVCDDDGDGFTEFDLHEKDEEITGGEPDVSVFYYATLADATANIAPLASPYQNVLPFAQTIYVRVQNVITNCLSEILTLDLIVLDGCPIIDTEPLDIFVNEGDGNGQAIFDLTVNEDLMLGAQDPTVYLFSYHTTFADAQTDANAVSNPESYQNTANPQTIYVRFYNNGTNGYVVTNFEIETDGVLGVDDVFSDNLIIYPNPASEWVVIQQKQYASDLEIVVLDVNGRRLTSGISSEEEVVKVDMATLASGMYWLQLTSEGNTVVKKIVKQ
ncbi:MAG: T9SS type A sorting domain-containing protein [Bacteroidota bacterium]